MMFTRLAVVAALLGAAAADFQIFSPSKDVWWIEKSVNTLAWTCNDPAAKPTFTVLVANVDQKVLTSPIAIIGIQNNFDCSKTITQDMLTTPPGTGYTILFANTLNQTDIFFTSPQFEIKPLGSSYPTATSTPGAASPTGSGSAGNSSASSSPGKNAAVAVGVRASMWMGVSGAVGVVGGLVGMFL
ncbi:hypothetical protein FPV67DRAFT_1165860 [Lyophyllum atratum]|nr:hypothetical protein FPV67DRAFT_1165860 [Lyophyllum atratum]